MTTHPPPDDVCNACQRPLPEEERHAGPQRWLPPDLEMLFELSALTDLNMRDAVFPMPTLTPGQFFRHREHYPAIMRVLAIKGPLLLMDLVNELKDPLGLSAEPIKDRLWTLHDYGYIDINPPDKGRRKLCVPPPDGERHNAKVCSVNSAGLLALVRIMLFPIFAAEDTIKRGLSLENVVDPDLDIAGIIADARAEFERSVRVDDKQLGRRLEIESLELG